MYLPDQVLRTLAPEGMTAVEQRAADEHRGRIAAGMSRYWRHRTEQAQALAELLVLTVFPSAFFRKLGPDTLRGQAPARPASPHAVPETVAKPGLHVTSRR